jgi:tetratricopeptide (TPR) repeat protein
MAEMEKYTGGSRWHGDQGDTAPSDNQDALERLRSSLNHAHKTSDYSAVDISGYTILLDEVAERLFGEADQHASRLSFYTAFRALDLLVRLTDSLLAAAAALGAPRNVNEEDALEEVRFTGAIANATAVIYDAHDDLQRGSLMRAMERATEAEELAPGLQDDLLEALFCGVAKVVHRTAKGRQMMTHRDFAGARVEFSATVLASEELMQTRKAMMESAAEALSQDPVVLPSELSNEAKALLYQAEAEEQLVLGDPATAAQRFSKGALALQDLAAAAEEIGPELHQVMTANAMIFESRAAQAEAEAARNESDWSSALVCYERAEDSLDRASEAALRINTPMGNAMHEVLVRTAYEPIFSGRRAISVDRRIHSKVETLQAELDALRSAVLTGLSSGTHVTQDFSNLVSITDSLKQSTQTAISFENNLQSAVGRLAEAINEDLAADPVLADLKAEGEALAAPTSESSGPGFIQRVRDYAKAVLVALEGAGSAATAVKAIADTIHAITQ